MKPINRILVSTFLFMIFVIAVGFFVVTNNSRTELVCGTPDTIPFCGTVSNLTENGQKGKNLFNQNCASCHIKDRIMTGPAFAKMDSQKIKDWLSNKNEALDSSKFNEWGIDYHKNTFGQTFEENEIGQIIEYSWTN